MRKLMMISVCIAGLVSGSALAGPGHEHGHGHSHGPVSADDASGKAIKKLEQLVKAGKIEESWAGTKPATVEKKTFSQGPEWVVSFSNKKVADASKQTLYMFYSLDGHYIAANYTGN